MLYGVYLLLFIAIWELNTGMTLRPFPEVFNNLRVLWVEKGFSQDIGASLQLNVLALMVSFVFTLCVSYIAVLPVFRPIPFALSKGRFLGLLGLNVIFIEIFGLGLGLKVALLTFGTSVFYATSMYTIVTEIPQSRYDYARAMGLSELQIVWHVVIRGTADQMLEALRQNAAIGWMMITAVEGIVKAGGIGDLLWHSNRNFNRGEVLAIIMVILFIGIIQDVLLRNIQLVLVPHIKAGRR